METKNIKSDIKKLSKESLDKIIKEHNLRCNELAIKYGKHHLDNINKVDEYGMCTLYR